MESPFKSPYKIKTSAYNSQAQMLILNVLYFIRAAKEDPTLLDDSPTEVAAKALNVTRNTISHISKKADQNQLGTPSRTKPKAKPIFDSFDICAIRNLIEGFYRNKVAPTVKLIMAALRNSNTGPKVSRAYLSKVIHGMGYRFKRLDSRVHLTEQFRLKEWRKKYIQRLNENKASDTPKPVIYIDESWIDCHATATMGWVPKVMKSARDRKNHTINRKAGKGPRLIMVHAGSSAGFVQGALLLKDSKTECEDYHKEMDGYGFENWFRNQLLPNIPPNSIIVMDNAPYHSLADIPKSKDRVGSYREWLTKEKIAFPPKATKKELWALIKSEKGNTSHYYIDKMAREQGHEVLRLPPYHCDLNPIELVWGHVKQHVAAHNDTGNVHDVKKLAELCMTNYNPNTWLKSVEHCERLADAYQKADGFSPLPPPPGQIVISLQESDSSDSDSSDSDDSDSSISEDSSDDDWDHDEENLPPNFQVGKFRPSQWTPVTSLGPLNLQPSVTPLSSINLQPVHLDQPTPSSSSVNLAHGTPRTSHIGTRGRGRSRPNLTQVSRVNNSANQTQAPPPAPASHMAIRGRLKQALMNRILS